MLKLYRVFSRLSVIYSSQVQKSLPALVLYSKSENCSLCDDAKEVLLKHKEKFKFVEVDITSEENKKWFELYKYDIPVIHLNGKEIMRHRIFENVLLDAIDIVKGTTIKLA